MKGADRDSAYTLLATASYDQKNHQIIRERRAIRDVVEEFVKMTPNLMPTCLSALAALAVTEENRAMMHEDGCVPALVSLLYNPVAPRIREQALRCLALLMASNPSVAKEVVEASGVHHITAALHDALAVSTVGVDDPMLAHSLWALAAVSVSPASHIPLMQEGVVEMMAGVLANSNSLAYCDYALSCLLQLTAREDCRAMIMGYNLHTIMAFRLSCGFPSVIRRCLQVMGNLCIDENSRLLIVQQPHLFETVIACAMDYKDTRVALQALKLMTNLVQTEQDAQLFCAAAGMRWLSIPLQKMVQSQAPRTLSPKPQPQSDWGTTTIALTSASARAAEAAATDQAVLEGQAVVLLASLLVYEGVQRIWVSSNGIPILMFLLESPQPLLKREAARAISNLASLDDDFREQLFVAGAAHALVKIIGTETPEGIEGKAYFQVHLSALRALASLTFNLKRSAEVLYIGILDEMITTLMKQYSLEDYVSIASLALSVLSNLTAFSDAKTILLSHAKTSAWLIQQIGHSDQSLQLHAIRLFTRLATCNEGRKWVNESAVVCQKLQATADVQSTAKNLKNYAQLALEIFSYPYDSGSAAPRLPEEDSKAKKIDFRVKRRARTITGQQLANVACGGTDNTLTPSLPTAPCGTPRAQCLQRFCIEMREYINTLNKITWAYVRPLLAFSGLIPPTKPGAITTVAIRTIFGGSETISLHAATLQDVLENRVWAPSCIVADALTAYFTKVIPIYMRYADNFHLAVAALSETHRRCSPFASFMSRCEASGNALYPILTLPLQRVSRYITFLEELASLTPVGDQDRQPVLDLMQIVAPAAARMRHEQDEAQAFAGLLQLERLIQGDYETLIAAGRRVESLQGHLLMSQLGNSPLDGPADVFAFLLSDLLLLARPSSPQGGACVYIDRIPLAECVLFTAADDQELEKLPEDQRLTFRLQRLAVVNGAKLVLAYVFGASTAAECSMWVNAITALLAKLPTMPVVQPLKPDIGPAVSPVVPSASIIVPLGQLSLSGGIAPEPAPAPVLPAELVQMTNFISPQLPPVEWN